MVYVAHVIKLSSTQARRLYILLDNFPAIRLSMLVETLQGAAISD